MNYIYKIAVEVNIFSNFVIRIFKYAIKNETEQSYTLLNNESLKVWKTEINNIQEGLVNKGTENIDYFIWVLDKNDILKYKDKMIEKIRETIKIHKQQIQIIERKIEDNKIKFYIHDKDGIQTDINDLRNIDVSKI